METKIHSFFANDNIISRITSYYFHYIFDIIRKNFINEKIILRKFPYKFIIDLKRVENDKLFNMKIKDIYLKVPFDGKYIAHYDKDYNKKIIEKIYKEGKEIKVIQILELTFKELFIIFRKKLNVKGDEEEIKNIKKKIEGLDLLDDNNYPDIKYCLEHMRRIHENDQGENEEYINKIKNYCCNYESWFVSKIGRIKRKK